MAQLRLSLVTILLKQFIEPENMKILLTKPFALTEQKNAKLMTQLSEVLAYKNIEDMRTHLLLELDNETIELDSIKQLFSLFEQWDIDKSPLESLLQLAEMK